MNSKMAADILGRLSFNSAFCDDVRQALSMGAMALEDSSLKTCKKDLWLTETINTEIEYGAFKQKPRYYHGDCAKKSIVPIMQLRKTKYCPECGKLMMED